MRRVDQLIGQFLKLNYELSLWTVYGTLRGMLLEDMEAVHCNLCGSNGHVEVARKDKFNLAVRSVMCRQCGLAGSPWLRDYRCGPAQGYGTGGQGASWH